MHHTITLTQHAWAAAHHVTLYWNTAQFNHSLLWAIAHHIHCPSVFNHAVRVPWPSFPFFCK